MLHFILHFKPIICEPDFERFYFHNMKQSALAPNCSSEFMKGLNHQCTAASWVKTVGGAERVSFLFDTANV